MFERNKHNLELLNLQSQDPEIQGQQEKAFNDINQTGDLKKKYIGDHPQLHNSVGDRIQGVLNKPEQPFKRIKRGIDSDSVEPQTVQNTEKITTQNTNKDEKGFSEEQTNTSREREQQELSYEQKEVAGKQMIEIITDQTVKECLNHSNLNEQQKQILEHPEFKQQVQVELENSQSYGKRFKELAINFVTGAGAAAAIRIAVKRTADFLLPGAGIAAGTVAGGLAGWYGGHRAETQRMKEVQKYVDSLHSIDDGKERVELIQEYLKTQKTFENKKLDSKEKMELRGRMEDLSVKMNKENWEGLKGTNKLKRLVELRSQASEESFAHDDEAKKILAELNKNYSAERDKKKIRGAILRGAVTGALGGVAGNIVSHWFEHPDAIIQLKDHAQQIIGGVKDAHAAVFEHSANLDVHMHKDIWHTVKHYLQDKYHIKHPSNALVNRFDRIIAEKNSVQIMGDHGRVIGDMTQDIHMQEGALLKGFEQIDAAMQHGQDLHGQVLERFVQDVPQHVSDYGMHGANTIGDGDVEKILGLFGTATALDYANFRRERAQQQSEIINKPTAEIPGTDVKEFRIEHDWLRKADAVVEQLTYTIDKQSSHITTEKQFNVLLRRMVSEWEKFKKTVPEPLQNNPQYTEHLKLCAFNIALALEEVQRKLNIASSGDAQSIRRNLLIEASQVAEQKTPEVTTTTELKDSDVRDKAVELIEKIQSRQQGIIGQPDSSVEYEKLRKEIEAEWEEFEQDFQIAPDQKLLPETIVGLHYGRVERALENVQKESKNQKTDTEVTGHQDAAAETEVVSEPPIPDAAEPHKKSAEYKPDSEKLTKQYVEKYFPGTLVNEKELNQILEANNTGDNFVETSTQRVERKERIEEAKNLEVKPATWEYLMYNDSKFAWEGVTNEERQELRNSLRQFLLKNDVKDIEHVFSILYAAAQRKQRMPQNIKSLIGQVYHLSYNKHIQDVIRSYQHRVLEQNRKRQ